MRATITTTLLMAVLTFSVSADIYKWQDADGNTEYGQSPPHGVDAILVKTQPGPKAQPAREPLQDQVKKADEALAQRKAAREAAAEEKRQMEINKKNCSIARHSNAELGYGGHRLTRMQDGSYKRLTEEEKQQLITRNQQAIKEYCE